MLQRGRQYTSLESSLTSAPDSPRASRKAKSSSKKPRSPSAPCVEAVLAVIRFGSCGERILAIAVADGGVTCSLGVGAGRLVEVRSRAGVAAVRSGRLLRVGAGGLGGADG